MEWSPAYPPALYAAAGLGLAALLALARHGAASSAARGWLPLVLRGATLAVLLVILLGPVRVSRTTTPGRVPAVAYLVDGSRSMGLDGPARRIDAARRLMDAARDRLPEPDRARVELFRFGDELAAVGGPNDLSASDDQTRLREALEQLPGRTADDPPRAVVVFSDGRSTEADPYEALGESYRRLGIPVHAVPLGDPRTVGDVAVRDVVIPRATRPGEKTPVRVVVRGLGFAGRRAEVSVRSLDEPNRPPLASLPITLADGETVHELVVEPGKAKGRLEAAVSTLPGEAVAGNNRVPFRVGARDPKVRVIYMEGTTGGEYRFLHDALVEDPDIECLSMEVDSQYNRVQRLQRVDDRSLGYPTTRAELFGYDVVICSDIARSAFSQAQLDWTVELVGRRGGGFAMIGGNTSFGAGHWDQTAWDGIIPIDMSGDAQGGQFTLWNIPLKAVVPADALDHPVWRIVDDPARNREVLGRMPAFSGSNLIRRLKPAAVALGVTDRPVSNVGVMPLFSAQAFGRGRTFALSSDTTVDWGREFERRWGENDNRYFRKFWRNVVRWLAENSTNGNRRLRVETDKVLYRPGDPVVVTARAFDGRLEETRAYRLTAGFVAPHDGPGTPAGAVTLAPPDGDGGYTATLPLPSHGADDGPETGARFRRLRVTAREGRRVEAQADLDVQVIDDPPEYRDPRPDRPRLEALARGSGGRVLATPADLAAVISAEGRGRDRVVVRRAPAWDRPELWLLLLGLLTAEWAARRARGLA